MKHKSLWFAVLFFFVLIVLVGCSAISSGKITKKNHQGEYYTTQLICAGYSQQGSCTTWVPITNYHPPTWWFDISEGKESGWVYVSEYTYNQFEIGDYYEDPEDG